jgi:hypothetical protein
LYDAVKASVYAAFTAFVLSEYIIKKIN